MAVVFINLFTPVAAGASRNIDCRTPRSAEYQPMSAATHLLVGILVAALAILINVDLDVGVATPHQGATQRTEIIDRTLKGDRLFFPPNINPNEANSSRRINLPRTPASELELLDGCEALVSFLSLSPLARVAGRCVS
jgi:hypothetical protein